MTFTDFRTTVAIPNKATTLPAQATLTTVQGDNFDVALVLQLADGTPVNCTGWLWYASARYAAVVVTFTTAPQLNGVVLHLGPTDTAALPLDIRVPYDVIAIPLGETVARTVLAGTIAASARITPSP